ncbi:MAG: MFS transporter [Actinomycetota bacterium]
MLSARLDTSYAPAVRRAITPLTIAKIGANSAYRFAPPFLATISGNMHASLPAVGAALAVGELGGLGAPILGRIAIRASRRTSICSGLLVLSVAVTGCAASRNVYQLGVCLALLTMAKIVFDVGVISWISDRVAYEQRGRVVGLTETAWAGSLFIGVVIMGLVTGVTSWRWGYAVAAVAIICCSAFLRQRLPDEVAPVRVPRTADHVKPRLGKGWWVIVGMIALTASAQSVYVTFGKWLKDNFGFNDTNIAMVIFGFGAIELVATSSMIRFSDLWGKQRSAISGAALIIPFGIALAVTQSHVYIALPILALYIGSFEFAIVSALPLASHLVPEHPSMGIGFVIAGGTLGRALMSAPATAAFAAHGMWLPAALGACCAAITVLSQWRYRVSLGTWL